MSTDGLNTDDWESAMKGADSTGAPAAASTKFDPSKSSGLYKEGLIGLIGIKSIFSTGHDFKDIGLIKEALEERIKVRKGNLGNKIQTAILPEVSTLDSNINAGLPGLLLEIKTPAEVYVFPFFISNKAIVDLIPGIEVNIQNTPGASVPLVKLQTTPGDIIDKATITRIIDLKKGTGSVPKKVIVVGARDIDIDVINKSAFPVVLTKEALIDSIVDIMLKEWETAIQDRSFLEAVEQKVKNIPSPYVEDGNVFGIANGTGLVTATAISDSLHRHVKTSANLSVVLTSNGRGPNQNYNEAIKPNKVVNTAFANISLVSMPLNLSRTLINKAMQKNYSMGLVNPQQYIPFNAHIGLIHSAPGETMGSNTNLLSTMMSLLNLLSLRDGLWKEALIATSPTRGGLDSLDIRVDSLFASNRLTRNAKEIPKLEHSKMKDVKAIVEWLNMMAFNTPTYYVDTIATGNDSSINNIFTALTEKDKSLAATNQIIAAIDSLSDGEFSRIISDKERNKGGWSAGDSILTRTGIIVPDGVMHYNKQYISTGVIDEQFLSHVFGDDQAKVNEIMTYMLGLGIASNISVQARKYRMIRAITEISGGDYFVTGFKVRNYFNPKFLGTFARAMTAIGSIKIGSSSFGQTDLNMASYDFSKFIADFSMNNFDSFGVVNLQDDFSYAYPL